MASPLLVNLSSLIDDAKCYALVRQHRWPDGVRSAPAPPSRGTAAMTASRIGSDIDAAAVPAASTI
jgi:hypothetical protein